MLTLQKIAQVFVHDFSGGIPSKDSTLDVRDVILKARGYLNTVLKPIYFDKKNEGDNSAISQAIYEYECSLATETTGQKYIAIPDVYMALPHNKGIHRLFIKGDFSSTSDFVIQHTPGISSNLPHMKLKNIQYCYIEGMKIKMAKGCRAKKADKIMLQIINIAPDAIGDSDPLPIMPEQLAELNRMLKIDFAPFAQVPADKLNNQNTNIR
jgi:hypothetical protein